MSQDEATRGRPYYEKIRKDLREAIAKKRQLDVNLAEIEAEIAQTEAEYLESTSAAGNIIRGFDNYIKASSSSTSSTVGPGTATRRKGGISDQDRIFSRSSVSWSLPEHDTLTTTPGNVARTKSGADSASLLASQSGSGPSSARDTPTASGANKNVSKNKKKAGVQDKSQEDEADGERPTKRGKISWGRD